jgi:hypothetical protein
MPSPRQAIVAGIVLVALAVFLARGGHGFWLVFPLFWVFGGCGRSRRWQRREDVPREGLPREDVPRDDLPHAGAAAPDPTRDRHEAFPGSR